MCLVVVYSQGDCESPPSAECRDSHLTPFQRTQKHTGVSALWNIYKYSYLPDGDIPSELLEQIRIAKDYASEKGIEFVIQTMP